MVFIKSNLIREIISMHVIKIINQRTNGPNKKRLEYYRIESNDRVHTKHLEIRASLNKQTKPKKILITN